MVFNRPIEAADIEKLSHLQRYTDLRVYPAILEATNQYVLVFDSRYTPYDVEKTSHPLALTEVLRSLVVIRQTQLDQAEPFYLFDHQGVPLEGSLLVKHISKMEREVRIVKNGLPSTEGRIAKQMKDEITAIAKYLLIQSGYEIQSVEVNSEQMLSHGARGMIYKSEYEGKPTIIKTYPLLRPDDLYQVFVGIKFKDITLPGFPKIIRICEVNGVLAMEMEFIPNLIAANKITDQIPDDIIEVAAANMDNFVARTGRNHGDLHEENVQIQVTEIDGEKQFAVWFLDSCGLHGAQVESSLENDASEVARILNNANYRNMLNANQ